LIIVAVQPVVGLGLDRFGRRSFLIVGLLGYACSNAIFGLASGITGLFLAQLAQGIGAGLLWVAALAIVSDLSSADSRGQEYGGIEEMSIRGILIGTLAGFAVFYLLSRDALGGLPLVTSWRIVFLGFTAASLYGAGFPSPSSAAAIALEKHLPSPKTNRLSWRKNGVSPANYTSCLES
jgi:DHA1 family multidrug resistance protein-like MFS transporter